MSLTVYSTIIELLGTLFETIIIHNYLKLFFKEQKKKFNNLMFIVSYIMLSTITLITMNPLILVVVHLSVMLMYSSAFNANLHTKLTAVIIFGALLVLFDGLSGIILMIISDKGLSIVRFTTAYRLIGMLISKIMAIAFIAVISLNKEQKIYTISTQAFIMLSILPISSIIVICQLGDRLIEFSNLEEAIMSICGLFGLTASNFVVYGLFKYQLQYLYEKDRLLFSKKQFENQLEYYNDLAEKQVQIRKLSHDMKNALLSVSGYIAAGDIENGLINLEKLSANLNVTNKISDTGNPGIDAIIDVKYQKSKSMGIQFEAQLFISNEIKIDIIDICIIIGNALDNAIEACEKIPIIDKRKILIKITNVKEYINIIIQNSINERVQIQDNKLFTTKKDKLSHGYGVENIKSISSKYDGNVIFDQTNDTFSISILLKNIAKNPDMHLKHPVL